MSNYRRAKLCGGYYSFTIVTFRRKRFLVTESARNCLRNAINKVKTKREFETIAFCLMPNHLHCIWKLPENDCDFSTRWSLIKKDFTMNYMKNGGAEEFQSSSRLKHRHRGIWQKRFWEHQIRDERDLQQHVNYIHYNPVKHELVKDVSLWPWSTYHKYIKSGYYGKVDINNMQEQLDNVFIME